MDSLAQYENPTLRNNEIVKKLTCLNNIFKDIKELKEGKISYQLKCELSDVEDKLLEVERNLLKEAYWLIFYVLTDLLVYTYLFRCFVQWKESFFKVQILSSIFFFKEESFVIFRSMILW